MVQNMSYHTAHGVIGCDRCKIEIACNSSHPELTNISAKYSKGNGYKTFCKFLLASREPTL